MSVAMEDTKPTDVSPYCGDVKKLRYLVENLPVEFKQEKLDFGVINTHKDQVNGDKMEHNLKSSKSDEENDASSRDTISTASSTKSDENTEKSGASNNSSKSDKTIPENDDLIDLDDIELSDEDSWLYTPPKQLASEERSVSPYKWLRKDVEDPDNVELQIARTALVNKLEELAILSPVRKSQEQEKKEKLKNDSSPSDKPSQDTPRVIDSRTFTRSKKKKHSFQGDISLNGKSHEIANIPDSESKSMSNLAEIERHLLLSASRPLNDVADVHEIARLQEESLRLSSPCSTLRRSSAISLPGGRALHSAIPEAQSQRGMLKQVSVNGLHEAKSSQFVNYKGCNTPSTNCSPPDSPYSSSISLNCPRVADTHKGSLPNLSKAYSSLKRKGKYLNESRIQCPLPVHPGVTQLKSNYKSSTLPSQVRRESMPVSFHRELLPVPTVRRDSIPVSLSHKESHNTLQTPSQKKPVSPTFPHKGGILSPLQKQCVLGQSSRKQSVPALSLQKETVVVPSRRGSVPPPSSHKEFISPHSPNRGTLQSPLALSSRQNVCATSHSQSQLQLNSVHDYPESIPETRAVTSAPAKENHKPNLISPTGGPVKSGIPQPSKIPGPRPRSVIPVPSSAVQKQSLPDDSWSQGCF